ncbi:uncharacterized protein DNG_10417 [Cephalotrichum gorgonifer]|uniref:Uncharacterized protein n=1 Tax=Cephalotrichum gorgonifer TaxID=2041049 RepID=A0AAE8N9A5_9PEZI|nr:uncharacterized protein DNG_10417 [Cephalotrichum gorgonifer]
MTCYFLDGSVAPIVWPCDNSTTGASTCCPAGSTCYSNGVCQDEKGGVTDFLRAGCTDPTWDDPACLAECLDFSPEKIIGIRPCDGITRGTNYCCDDGSQGRGSFHCCATSSSLFTIGTAAPTILAEMPISWTSSTMSTTSSDSTPTNETPTPNPSPEEPAPGTGGSSSNLGVGLGAGLGVGLPAMAAVIGGLLFLARRRKKQASAPAVTQEDQPKYDGPPSGHVPEMGTGEGVGWSSTAPSELPGSQRPKYELP